MNLGTMDGIRRYIGTRYHLNDTYAEMIRRGSARTRIYPATINGEADGEPVLMPREVLDQKRRDMGPYTFGCQMMQNPTADKTQGFKREWLRFWTPNWWQKMNRFIIVDPANEKNKSSDYTAMFVIGLAEDGNYYVIDMVRDRLNLTERVEKTDCPSSPVSTQTSGI